MKSFSIDVTMSPILSGTRIERSCTSLREMSHSEKFEYSAFWPGSILWAFPSYPMYSPLTSSNTLGWSNEW